MAQNEIDKGYLNVPDIDHCSNNPCVHGTCTDTGATYSCTCDAGWTGPNCSQGMKKY